MCEKLVLGIDGGGTKTEAWLATVSPAGESSAIGRGIADSSNVRAVGWEQALANVTHSIQLAWEDAQQTPRTVEYAVLALAGSGQKEMSERLTSWAQNQGFSEQVEIIHDARAVLEAGSESGWGVALISGTGSVAYARNPAGKVAVSGGWGYWFGDEGSGFWIGQAALRAIANAADQLGPETRLTQAVLDRLEISEPKEILTALSSAGDVRSGIASLADLVTTAAEKGDEVATQIIDEAARHLAEIVISAAKKGEIQSSSPLSLAGGVLNGSPRIRESLFRYLADSGHHYSTVEIVSNPVVGCLRLASKSLLSTS